MLTAEDIKNVSFRKSTFGGYKPEDVDAFIDKLQISYEESEREKKNLNLIIQKLEGEIRKFREEEKSIKEVISDLKGITERSITEAELKAKDMISDAAKTSEEMITDAKKEVAIQEEISRNLKKESDRLKKSLDDLYKQHLEIMRNISDISLDGYDDNEKENNISKVYDIGQKNEEEVTSSKESICEKASGGTSSKFGNLEFGNNYRRSDSVSEGIYGGIFKENK